MWKSKKMDFKQKLPDTICARKGEKKAHFRAHYLFWPKLFYLGRNPGVDHSLSGPLRLRVQSQSRTQLRIVASVALLFRACFKEVLDTSTTIARLSFLGGLEQGGWELLLYSCVWMRGRAR